MWCRGVAFHSCLLSYRILRVPGKRGETEGSTVGNAGRRSQKMAQPQMKVRSGNLVKEQAQLLAHVALETWREIDHWSW